MARRSDTGWDERPCDAIGYIITGPPFVGKTTLAKKLARALRRRSTRKTIYVELAAIRRVTSSMEYDAIEDEIVHRAVSGMMRICLDVGANVIIVAPVGRRFAHHFAWQRPGSNVTHIQVKSSIEAVLDRQRKEKVKKRRAYVGEHRLREIYASYEYAPLPIARREIIYNSETDPANDLVRTLMV